jgi:hypothetical protein
MDIMTFKHEAEANGEAVGPITLRDSEAKIQLRPYDPNREVEWVTLTEARQRAKSLGLALEIV